MQHTFYYDHTPYTASKSSCVCLVVAAAWATEPRRLDLVGHALLRHANLLNDDTGSYGGQLADVSGLADSLRQLLSNGTIARQTGEGHFELGASLRFAAVGLARGHKELAVADQALAIAHDCAVLVALFNCGQGERERGNEDYGWDSRYCNYIS